MQHPRHLVLLGLMGAGKTSIGRRVAATLAIPLLDGDEQLERAHGQTAAELAAAHGIDHLHRIEADVLRQCLDRAEPAVVAPAASTIDDDECLAALRDHLVVWLTAPAAHLAAKARQKSHRPLVGQGSPDDDVALFEHQLAEREPRILPLAALVLDVTEVSKDDAAGAVVALVRSRAASPSSPLPS